MSGLLPLLGIVALIAALVGFAGTAVFIGGCMLVARFTDSRDDSPAQRGYRDRPRTPAPARRGGW